MADPPPNVIPFLRFADADAALEWLSRAFGFEPREVHRDDHGTISHAEVSLGPGHRHGRSPGEHVWSFGSYLCVAGT